MLLALNLFLQTGGVEAKPQVVFLRRKKECVYLWLAAKWQGPEHRLFPLLTGRWQWENKAQAFPAGGTGQGPGAQRQRLVSELGKSEPPRTKGAILVFSLTEPSSSATGNSRQGTAMQEWEELQPWPGRYPPPAFLGSYTNATAKWAMLGWTLKGRPGHPDMPGLDQWKSEMLVCLRSASKKKFAPGITLMSGRKANMERFAYLFWINHTCPFLKIAL